MSQYTLKHLAIVSDSQPGIKETPIIPDGKRIKLGEFRFSDIASGDGKSSVYVVFFGSEILDVFSALGSTQIVHINEELLGDGEKRIKIECYNMSPTPKRLPCRLFASIVERSGAG